MHLSEVIHPGPYILISMAFVFMLIASSSIIASYAAMHLTRVAVSPTDHSILVRTRDLKTVAVASVYLPVVAFLAVAVPVRFVFGLVEIATGVSLWA